MLFKDQISDKLIRYSSRAAFVNASFIEINSNIIVIDTMLLPRDGKDLAEVRKNYGKEVNYIINTHWHSDHCYGNRFLCSKDTKVIAHKDHFGTLENEKNVIRPDRDSIINRSNLRFPNILVENFYELVVDDQVFQLNHHPGHSNDSISIFWENERILFTGDTVLNSNDQQYAVPYFYWGNSRYLLYSLQKILELEPRLIITGHGKPVTIDKVKQDITYLNNLILLSKQFYNPNDTHIQLYETLKKRVKPELTQPGLKNSDFWVPEMHDLNLKKMVDELLAWKIRN